MHREKKEKSHKKDMHERHERHEHERRKDHRKEDMGNDLIDHEHKFDTKERSFIKARGKGAHELDEHHRHFGKKKYVY